MKPSAAGIAKDVLLPISRRLSLHFHQYRVGYHVAIQIRHDPQ